MSLWWPTPIEKQYKQTLYYRIILSPTYKKLKKLTKNIILFIPRRLLNLINFLIFMVTEVPKGIFNYIFKVIKSIWNTIKNIPTWPSRSKAMLVRLWKRISIIIFKQKFLRKKLIKYQLIFFFKSLIKIYFI